MAEESGAAQEQVMELSQEREQLRGQVQDLERAVDHLNHMIQESRTLENQLEERSNQLRVRWRVMEAIVEGLACKKCCSMLQDGCF